MRLGPLFNLYAHIVAVTCIRQHLLKKNNPLQYLYTSIMIEEKQFQFDFGKDSFKKCFQTKISRHLMEK